MTETYPHPKRKAYLYSGKEVLITGANSGIGLALAKGFGGSGTSATGLDLTIESFLQAHVELALKFTQIATQAGVTNVETLTKVANRYRRVGRTIDFLVMNAGVGQERPGYDISFANEDAIRHVNVTGTYEYI